MMTYEEYKDLIEQEEQGMEDVVYLPVGITYKGVSVRKVKIKEPDGFTESLQTDTSFRNTFNGIINATLVDCIIDIEGIDIPSEQKDKAKKKDIEFKLDFVRRLSEPDRQYIMLRIYRLQHGSQFETKVQCQHCQQNHTVTRDLLKDIYINFVDESSVDVTGDDRYLIKDVELEYPIKVNGEIFNVVDVRIPDGLVAQRLERNTNMGDVKTLMLLGMLINNQDKFTLTELDVKGWSTKVRDSIVESLRDRRKGFINVIKHTCTNMDCGEEFEALYQLSDFLGK